MDEEKGPRKYAAVFPTTLACLQRIDFTGIELLYEQKDAIRSLHYDSNSKIGIKLTNAWWIKHDQCLPIIQYPRSANRKLHSP